MLPQFSYAATSSLQINQQAGDVVPEPGGGSGGGLADTIPPQISNVVVTVQFNSVQIDWKTLHEFSTSKVSWGLNQDYSAGIVSSTKLLRDHTVDITNLEEKKIYYFLITSIDSSGNQSFYSGQFISGSKEDLTAPLNITNFNARASNGKIELTWENPKDADFLFTRVVRSTTFFPVDPSNGFVVYEGDGQNYLDQSVTPGIIYYYTAFTRDLTGNYSSGAISSAMIVWYSESELPVVDFQYIYNKNFPNTLLTIDDFIFSYQNGEKELSSRNIQIPVNESLFLSIDKRKLPSDVRFILWNSKDGSFFFTLNELTGNYELVLPYSGYLGSRKSNISIFNGAQQIIQDVPVTVNYSSLELVSNISDNKKNSAWNIGILGVSLLLSCFLLIRFFYRRGSRTE